jgi:hypothetical protein
LSEALLAEIENALYRVNLINTWVMIKVKEFNSFWKQLYNVLDDGIVQAIKLENDATQSVIRSIREHIINEQG